MQTASDVITEKAYQKGYTDAIENFAEILKSKPYYDDVHNFQSIPIGFIDEVAEQLEQNMQPYGQLTNHCRRFHL